MRTRAVLLLLVSAFAVFSNAEARTYKRSCSGGIWVTYHSDAFHLHTVGWLIGSSAKATARYDHYQPNTLRGRARDRLKNDCFQNLSCTGEMEVGGRMVEMSQPWPYASTYEDIATQIENHACENARLNFRDVRSIRAQLRITGDKNCGMSNSKNFYAEFFSKGNLNGPEVICSGRYPR